MKTYTNPVIEFAQFNHVNIVTDSLGIDKDNNHPGVGAPDRYDDDED